MPDLRDRAAAAAGRDVATTDRTPTGQTLADQIKVMRDQFQLAMPRGLEASQLVRDAQTALRTTPNLAKATPDSVLGSLMTCAQLGLRPGVLGHAWVLPYWNSRKKIYVAQLIIGYQGYIDLAHRSGKIASLSARTVFEHDTYDVQYGLEDNLIHRPLLSGDRGQPVGYYSVVKYTTGGHAFFWMSHQEMTQWRDMHAPRKDGRITGPWNDHFEPMAWKTTILRLARWMPKSTELASAIAVDDSVRVDVSPLSAPEDVSAAIEGDVVDLGDAAEMSEEDEIAAQLNAEAAQQAAEKQQ